MLATNPLLVECGKYAVDSLLCISWEWIYITGIEMWLILREWFVFNEVLLCVKKLYHFLCFEENSANTIFLTVVILESDCHPVPTTQHGPLRRT